MDTALPSLTELGQAQFIDPQYFNQVQNQIGLGNQFAQQNLAQGAQDLQAKTLANQFNEAQNPQLLQQQQIANTRAQQLATQGAIDTNIKTDLAPQEKQAKLQKYLKDASDDEVNQLNAEATARAMKASPLAEAGDADAKAELDKANIMRDQTDAVRAARAQQAAKLAETNAMVGGRVQVAGINAGAKIGATTLTTQSAQLINGVNDATRQKEILAKLQLATPDKLAAEAMNNALHTQDPDERSKFLEQANIFHKMDMESKPFSAGINTPSVANLPSNASAAPALNAPASAVIPRPQAVAPVNGQLPPLQQGTRPVVPVIPASQSGTVINQNGDQGNAATPGDTAAQQASDIAAITKELGRSDLNPDTRRILTNQLQATQRAMGATPAPSQAAPAIPPQGADVPQGRVKVFQNGKAVGTVPAAQVQSALSKGYTLQ